LTSCKIRYLIFFVLMLFSSYLSMTLGKLEYIILIRVYNGVYNAKKCFLTYPNLNIFHILGPIYHIYHIYYYKSEYISSAKTKKFIFSTAKTKNQKPKKYFFICKIIFLFAKLYFHLQNYIFICCKYILGVNILGVNILGLIFWLMN
jgi:hypothetical protein